jgi:hypothetical protein
LGGVHGRETQCQIRPKPAGGSVDAESSPRQVQRLAEPSDPTSPTADKGNLIRLKKSKHLATFAGGHEKVVPLGTKVVYQSLEIMDVGGMADVDRDSH